MVSQVKGTTKRPNWIGETLWGTMCDHWATEESQSKSSKASNSRNSTRDGLGAHKHLSGQKSYLRIKQDLEKEKGRPVSIGEVFIKTHTKADGTYVDLKAKQICESYSKNLEDRLSQIGQDVTSDGTSQRIELTPDDLDQLFLETSTPDERGRHYGLGSLQRIYGRGPDNKNSGTVAFQTVHDQLLVAQRKIEEQAAENARLAERESENAKVVAEHQDRIRSLEMVITYMRGQDPGLAAYMAANASTSSDPDAGSSSPH